MKKKKFSIYKFLETRPLSWSAISSFEYDPEQWYRRYILDEKEPPNKEMVFGKMIGERLASDKNFLPQVDRHLTFEQKLEVRFGKIPMIGFMDTSHLPEKKFREFKTGKTAWTQKRVDEHGQIDMYLLMIYIAHRIKPEEMTVHLDWLKTVEHGDFTITLTEPVELYTFKTKRTMAQLLKFGAHINRIVTEMEEYANSRVV